VLRGDSSSPGSGNNWLGALVVGPKAIDDSGHAMLVVGQIDSGGNAQLTALHGTLTGSGMSWSPPVPLNLPVPAPLFGTLQMDSGKTGLAMSPAGNALFWVAGPDTTCTWPSGGQYHCRSVYVTRYLAAAGTWDAPVEVAKFSDTQYASAVINDRGDIVFMANQPSQPSDVNTGRTAYWRAANSATFGAQSFPALNVTSNAQLGIDAQGRMLVGISNNGDIEVYRGTLVAGFGAPSVLASQGGFGSVTVGVNGQQLVTWLGSGSTTRVAASDGPDAPFLTQDLGQALTYLTSFDGRATVLDDGTMRVVGTATGTRWGYAGGAWSALSSWPQSLQAALARIGLGGHEYDCSAARNGNLLCVLAGAAAGFNWGWLSYDAASNSVVEAAPDVATSTSQGPQWLYGTSAASFGTPGNINLPGLSGRALLSSSGLGVYIQAGAYASWPTPGVPAVDGAGVANLNIWAFELR